MIGLKLARCGFESGKAQPLQPLLSRGSCSTIGSSGS
jgi:hypothetical protein